MRLLLVGAGATWSTRDVEDGYRAALETLGHEVVYYSLAGRLEVAAQTLDIAWRRAGKPEPRPTLADIYYMAGMWALERAARFETEWTLVISGMFFHPDLFVLLRRTGQRVALILTESPYDDEQQAKVAPLVDVVFTNERASVPALQSYNPNTHYLGHAYDPAKHHAERDDGADVPAHDVVFVGTGFVERCKTLAEVDWDGIDLGLYGTWPLLGSRSKLRQHLRGGVTDNATTAALYRRARIGLNLYRTSMGFGRDVAHVWGAESLNPRALELAATGCFTLSDHRPEVSEIFGGDVPTFQTPKQLGILVRRYLNDERARRECAARLPARVAGQTYEARAEQLVSTLERA